MQEKQKTDSFIYLILLSAIGVVFYKLLVLKRLEQTAALFIGLPTILAIALVSFVKPKSSFGYTMVSITMVILFSAIFLGEGAICILIAAPLAYFIGAILSLATDAMRRRRENRPGNGPGNGRGDVLVLLPFIVMSLEGLSPRLSFPRENTVQVESLLEGSPASIRQKLAEPMQFKQSLPPFFLLGFPLPTGAIGQGLEPGARRTVHFAGGEGQPGDLTWKITAVGDNWMECKILSDTSHIAHWLAWQKARVEWTAIDAGHTRVRSTVHYRRDLDPAWYFGPLQHYGVRLAVDFLNRGLENPTATK
jgi:hypothetical protein